jgi:glutathione S-transferase
LCAAGLFAAACASIAQKLARLEEALGDRPYFAGTDFGLVDAAFAPAFRYFDVFDAIGPTVSFVDLPKTAVWRKALAARPSVRDAVSPAYPDLLSDCLLRHEAVLLARAA